MAVLHLSIPGKPCWCMSFFFRKEETLHSHWKQAYEVKPGEVTTARRGFWTYRLYVFFLSESHRRPFQIQMFHTSVPPLICLQIYSITALHSPSFTTTPTLRTAISRGTGTRAMSSGHAAKTIGHLFLDPGKSSWRVKRRRLCG